VLKVIPTAAQVAVRLVMPAAAALMVIHRATMKIPVGVVAATVGQEETAETHGTPTLLVVATAARR
jgi:hypothetical protein